MRGRPTLVLESLAGEEVWSAPVEMGSLPPAASESVNLLREPDAANPHVRFDEREVETEHIVPPRHLSTLLSTYDAIRMSLPNLTHRPPRLRHRRPHQLANLHLTTPNTSSTLATYGG